MISSYDRSLRTRRAPGCFLLAVILPPALPAQQDPGRHLNAVLSEKTAKRLQLSAEVKQRVENRTGILFGRDRDITADFVRLRLGVTIRPLPWMKISGLMQDTRAPFYGGPPPGNVRDPHDLQEGYIELFSPRQAGFGITVGRQMLSFGDSRLIGSPQWAYTARTWDNARLYHVSKRARLEAVFLSTIQPRGSDFNYPTLGDRIWGVYNTFKDVGVKNVVDVYVLRHDQNRPGGFTGPGTLAVNLFGSRWAVPLPRNFRFTAEGILQNGRAGLLPHRAGAGVILVGYKTTVWNRPLDLANEYKYASGTNPSSGKSGTFDQLYPAAHDKLGHIDLLGWKNVHNVKSLSTLNMSKQWSFILMYNATWLADRRDGVYTAQGRLIVRSADGSAGRYVGQEVDLFTNYQAGSFNIAGGIGQFVPGGFIRRTTPGAFSRLIYLSTSYSF